MDDQSKLNNSLLPAIQEDLSITPGWSSREMKELEQVEKEGAKAISPSLAASMFALFLEGYSCAEIVKQNKNFSEGDILYCRKKFKWDEEKDRYAFDLNKQMREKLVKTKLEAIEMLTNTLSVMHTAKREGHLKYLQTKKAEDLPTGWDLSPTQYKSIFETIQKVTGEDRITKQEIRSDSTVRVEGSAHSAALHPELQAKMLQKLAIISQTKKSTDGKNE